MNKNIITSILWNALITLIVSLLTEAIVLYLTRNDGVIEISSSKIESGKYENVISIKNMNDNKYLDEFEIIINENIKVQNEKIIINKIDPLKIQNIIFYSDKEVLKDDIKIINNNMKFEVQSLNEYSDFKVRYFILIVIYVLINSIVLFFAYRKSNNERDKTLVELNKAHNEQEKLLKRLDIISDETTILNVAYIKELSDLVKQNEFYKNMCIKLSNNIYTKEELDSIVKKELKILYKKNIKDMDYSDIMDIVTILYKNVKNECINGEKKKYD